MKYKAVKTYLLKKPEAVEDYPFGPEAAVFKVKDKMFAILTKHQGNDIVNLKCDPNEALMLRDLFDAVIPGYHMNKVHWNSVILDGTVPSKEIQRMIDRSYSLIVKSLKKAQRTALELAYGEEALYH
jgi:predicted DNA-binding protein (MmcQ/YjbR family)